MHTERAALSRQTCLYVRRSQAHFGLGQHKFTLGFSSHTFITLTRASAAVRSTTRVRPRFCGGPINHFLTRGGEN